MPASDGHNRTTFQVKTIKNFCLLSMQNQQQGSCLCGRFVCMTVPADRSAKADNLRIDKVFTVYPLTIAIKTGRGADCMNCVVTRRQNRNQGPTHPPLPAWGWFIPRSPSSRRICLSLLRSTNIIGI